MKKTIKVFAILAVLLFAASCQNTDIDNGQAIDNGSFTVTATIVAPDATRVTYDVDNETSHTITPAWTVGDAIIGFDDADHTFTFTVASVDGSGRATLDANGYVPGAATKLYAIYYPGKTVSDFGGSASDYTLAVDLSSQAGAALNDNSPVLMCATADITAGSASLSFENQAAIIGVTKFKLPAAATVTSVSVDGLIPSGTFKLDGGALVLTPGTTPSTITATGSWATGEGNICTTALYFATLPTDDANIVLNANDGVNDYANLSTIATADIEAGYYYYMQKNLGAPVADVNGVKYGTIDDAFAAANRATSAVTLTLLADCTSAGMLSLDSMAFVTGAVTLDLNGRTLTVTPTGSKGIEIAGTRSLTVRDGASGGKIVSSAQYMVYATGTAPGGAIKQFILQSGSLNGTYTGSNNSTALHLITNNGNFEITGGSISATNTEYRGIYLGNNSTLTVSNLTVDTKTNCVRIQSGEATISGGTYTSAGTSSTVYVNGGTATISGGYHNSGSINPIGLGSGTATFTDGYFNKPIQSSILGDGHVNVLNTDVGTKAEYPFTISPIASTPKVATLAQSTYSWDFGTIEGAMKGADVRAKANGNSTVTLTDDCTATSTMSVSAGNTYSVTLDLHGHVVSSTASPAISTGSTFTLTDSDSDGEVATTGAVALTVTAGTATVNAGSLFGASNAASVSSGANLIISGGYIYGNDSADIIGAGTTTVYGGFFRYNPASFCAASAASSDVTENFGGRTYNYQVVATVATVNGVGYPTLADAATAAVAYDGASETVTLKLLDDVTHNVALNLAHPSKPVILDLNGHILSTTVNDFIYPTSGTLTITDSQNKVGKITTSGYQVIRAASTLNIVNCIIEGTIAEASAYDDQSLLLIGGSSTTTISGSRLYTCGKQTVLRVNNKNCSATVNDNTEITAGKNGLGFNGVYVQSGTFTFNSGSIYKLGDGNNQPAIGTYGSSNAKVTVNGGYFYTESPSWTLRKASGSSFTLKGGHMDKAPSTGGTAFTYGSGMSLQDCDEYHDHATTGTNLHYTKVVTTTP